jgi:octaprenyl-diphosphate synthase
LVTGELDCVAEDLKAVEQVLAHQALSDLPLVHDVCDHVRRAGGKRLRPALVLLFARALGCHTDEPVWAAAAVEMVHAATLMHDDVVDLADSRRGQQTAVSLWGPCPAVMGGNILLAKSFGSLVDRGQIDVLQLLSATALTMCRGEILQNANCGSIGLARATYLEIIRSKTAEFLSACCRIGAMLANAKALEAPAANYGLELGLAFQIIDDLLDYVGEPAVTGKPVGGDLREGKVTLPLIVALETAPAADVAELKRLATRGEHLTPDEFRRVLGLLQACGAIDSARCIANEHARNAARQLDDMPPSAHRDALLALASKLVYRQS